MKCLGNAGEWEESYGTIDGGAVFGILTCGKQLNFPSRFQIDVIYDPFCQDSL